MARLGIRIANVVLAGLCCFQIASVVNRISADLLMPTPATHVETGRPDPGDRAAGGVSWAARKPILDRNLFGAQIFPVEVQVAEPEPEPELEETKLPLRLLATLRSAIPAHSTAAISGRGPKPAELIHEGDTLEEHPTVQVAKIERGRVILQNGPRREELLLSEDEPPKARTQPPRRMARRPRSRGPSPSARAQAPSLVDRLKDLDLRGESGRSARSLFSQAKITPKWEDGQMVGMELDHVEEGSLYEQVGLRAGDVITSFNGITLDSAAAGAKVLTQFADAESYEIELDDGRDLTVTQEQLSEFLDSEQDDDD